MSDPKPRIQLSCEQGAFAAYADAVTAAGGLPCPGYAPEPDLSCVGLVLCGGGDLDPDMFGWPQAGGDPPDRVRDLAEVNLFRAFYLAGRPILGICRGMQVIAAGRVSVFPRDGQYQLYCSRLTPEGAGDLHVAFEQLKEKLAGEGLFAPEHKKPLPPMPKTIALITSPVGAAVRDMLRILKARWPMAQVRVLPVRVQGEGAAEEISAAIAWCDREKAADLIITGRGGGSMEDLWAFNEEIVARAIYRCRIPVISAVGHEPDVTIADYVADLRAATPSNAAELAVPDQNEVYGRLLSLEKRLEGEMDHRLAQYRRRLDRLAKSRAMTQPGAYFQTKRLLLDYQSRRLNQALERTVAQNRERLAGLAAALDAMSPMKVLGRGYAIARDGEGRVLSSVKQTGAGEKLTLRLADGSLRCHVDQVQGPEQEV